jgi:hypothetical protein
MAYASTKLKSNQSLGRGVPYLNITGNILHRASGLLPIQYSFNRRYAQLHILDVDKPTEELIRLINVRLKIYIANIKIYQNEPALSVINFMILDTLEF